MVLEGMNFGNSITSIALADLFDKHRDRAARPLRPSGGASGSRSSRVRRGSGSFSDHPERW